VSLFGPTVAFLHQAVGLSAAMAGLLISIPNLTGSLLRIPFSARVDRDGGRRPFIILLSVSLIGVIGIAAIIAQPLDRIPELYGWLIFFGALGGFGSATFSVGISQTSYWFDQSRQGTALGTYAGLGNLAPGIFAFFLSTITIPRFGLATSYVIWAVLLAIGTAIYLRIGRNAPYFQVRAAGVNEAVARSVAREHGQRLFPANTVVESLKRSAQVWQTWALVVVYFTSFGGFMALTGWFPKYWEGYHAASIGMAGSLAAAYSILASLSRVAGGRVADRLGGERTALASLVLLAIAAVAMAYVPVFAVTIAAMLVMAVTMGVTNAAVFKIVPQVVPDAVGGAAGWVGGLGAFGGFVIPNLMAAFLGGGPIGYARGFITFILLAAISAVAVIVLRRSAHRIRQASAPTPAPRQGGAK
jgi:NNP family nitrate/nitrite transporter-like MFS transporter